MRIRWYPMGRCRHRPLRVPLQSARKRSGHLRHVPAIGLFLVGAEEVDHLADGGERPEEDVKKVQRRQRVEHGKDRIDPDHAEDAGAQDHDDHGPHEHSAQRTGKGKKHQGAEQKAKENGQPAHAGNGVVVHPAAGNWDGTLVNALMYHCGDSLSGINGEHRPGIVHRIDKDTSGLLVVAKNDAAHQSLAAQIAAHTAYRGYEAIVVGSVKDDTGTVDKPIARHKTDRKKMAIVEGGREAITHYTVIKRYNGYTYMAFQLETGRTHQIRVHMASIGHPIIGDPVYGLKKDRFSNIGGQCLHAAKLTLTHPKTGERMEFSASLPQYFTEVLDKLERMQ